MSDKERQKKDGEDKNKKNQRRRQGESNAALKKAGPTSVGAARKTGDSDASGTQAPPRRPAPAVARTHASKASKGK